ncbi:MAG TPA: hypothetical protein VER17_09085 [Tepidisphaeraceae bacterium]|nr:hypothetical protein [Tepidisphaeraceae bacterium]
MRIASVVGQGSEGGTVWFDGHVITLVGGGLLGLELNAGGGGGGGGAGNWIETEIADWGDDYILFTALSPIVAGMAWRVLSGMPVMWDDDPTVTLVVPEAGVVG